MLMDAVCPDKGGRSVVFRALKGCWIKATDDENDNCGDVKF